MATHANGLILSVTAERIRGKASAEGRRRAFRDRIKASPKGLVVGPRESQAGEIAMLEYMTPEFGGAPIQQKHVLACLAKEDTYVDIHLSQVKFKPSDEATFALILEAVRLTDQKAPAEPTSLGYLSQGSAYYLRQQYDKAIPFYEKALHLEKQERKLGAGLWRMLVDNLGMAYGMTGNLKAAEEVFQYGFSEDPTYPVFHYNMACTYAERNDLENAMKYLATAFQYKRNMIPGENMPDPRTDDSFQRFLKNERFRKLIDSLREGGQER